MKIYISGAISSLPESEYKSRFSAAEETLKEIGYQPVNPLNIIHEHDCSWENYMIEDIRVLFQCPAIYMLNKWRGSKGARIEHAIAIETGMKIIYQP